MRLLVYSLILALAVSLKSTNDVGRHYEKLYPWNDTSMDSGIKKDSKGITHHLEDFESPSNVWKVRLLRMDTQISTHLRYQNQFRQRRDLQRMPNDEGFPRNIEKLASSPVRTMATSDRGDEPPALEIAAMITDVFRYHLYGCQKVLLHSQSAINLDVAEILKSLMDEAVIIWHLEMFVSTLPPAFPIFSRSHNKASNTYCVAFVMLASLQEVGRATQDIQRSDWFQGAEKMVLAYTGSQLDLQVVAGHPVLGSGYHTVLVSWWNQSVTGDVSKDHHDPVGGRFYRLLRTCPYCQDGGPEVDLGDTWTPEEGFALGQSLFPDVFKDFQGHVFSIVTLEYAPFSCYEKTETTEVRLKDCVDTRMVNSMAQILNFTYHVSEPSDQQWGYKLDNGTYTGVIGAIQNYAADFSLNVAFTGDREKVIDYTVGYFNDPLTFCTTKPRPLNQAFALLRPFHPTVWIGFAMTLALLGPLYYFNCRVLPARLHQHGDNPAVSHIPLSKAILTIYGSCISQNVPWSKSVSARVLAASWILFSLVTMTSYVAMLIASYTLPTLSPTLNSLQELIDSDFSWGIQDLGAADYQLFKTSKVPLYQKVFSGLDLCPDLNECIARARDTRYAFITWRLYMEDRIAIKFTSGAGERQLHVASEDFFPSEIGWAMNPGCPFRVKFNNIIRRLLEAGLISKWLDQIINDPRRREAVDVEDLPRLEGPQPLGLEQLQGVFYIFVMGSVISVALFSLEFCVKF